MLWADVPWAERIDGLGGFHRLLAIPLLLVQFRRSQCGPCACYGFLISASVVLALSWFYALFPSWAFAHVPFFGAHVKAYGVPAKDYILQSGIFLICAFGLIGAACERWREARWRTIAALLCLAACFLANIAFVAASRTTVVVAPLLAIVLGYRYFGWRGVALAGIVAAALAAVALQASPYLHLRVMHSFTELRTYLNTDAANSTGLHMEYLKKSAAIVAAAPVIGHGTGSIAEQFRLVASGDTGSASAVATVNPHNQIFAVAIELGVRRRRSVAGDVGRAWSAVSRRRPDGLDRHHHRRAEFSVIAWSIRICSISARAGSMCSASASSAAPCCATPNCRRLHRPRAEP